MSKVTERSNSNPTVQEKHRKYRLEQSRCGGGAYWPISPDSCPVAQRAVGPPWFRVLGRIRYRPDLTDKYLEKSRQDPVAGERGVGGG